MDKNRQSFKNWENIKGEWKTINGARIFIRDGQSVEDALKELEPKQATQDEPEQFFQDELTNSISKGKLVIDSSAARELHSRIAREDYLSLDELKNHPVVKEMDRLAEYYKGKYGDTSLIDRKAQRDEWEQDFLSIGSAVKGPDGKYTFGGKIRKEHKLVIAIGLPASGKSTMIANPTSEELGAFIFDSDEIKKLIPEYQETNGGASGVVHNESKMILVAAKHQFLSGARNGENLVIPVIGDDVESLQKKWIKPFEDAGYDVEVKYQDADPIESANRVVKRAIEEGRIIPSDKVLAYGDKPRGAYETLKTMKNKGGKPYVRP